MGKCTHECSAAGIHQLDPTPHRSPSASKPHTRHSLNHLSATACVHGDGLATGMPPSPVLSPVQLPTPQWCPLRSNPHMGWQQEEVAPRVHGRSWEQDAGSIRGVRAWDKSEWSSLTKAVAVCPRGAMLQCVFFLFSFLPVNVNPSSASAACTPSRLAVPRSGGMAHLVSSTVCEDMGVVTDQGSIPGGWGKQWIPLCHEGGVSGHSSI